MNFWGQHEDMEKAKYLSGNEESLQGTLREEVEQREPEAVIEQTLSHQGSDATSKSSFGGLDQRIGTTMSRTWRDPEEHI